MPQAGADEMLGLRISVGTRKSDPRASTDSHYTSPEILNLCLVLSDLRAGLECRLGSGMRV